MTDWEERMCQMCHVIGGLYFRREALIARGETDKAEALNPHIELRLKDLKEWLLKNGEK